MARQFFVLGIGGTGMRCIESLIHLCAMGMFDDTDIHLLALDTDKNNGNFARLKELKEAYVNTKGMDKASHTALKDTYFSANIHYYEFSPNYEKKATFKEVFNYTNTQYSNKTEADLADLVLTDKVEEFNLQHGYRAQTHLGSMMMYHSILEAAQCKTKNDLKTFVEKLTYETNSGKARVFILGSVFGGTGASSIPIIPQAICKAAEIITNGTSNIMPNAFFGSTLLTAYFSFNLPSSKDEREAQKIIATSDKFALNSQAAMMFYNDDKTVRNTYQRFYMMGTAGQKWNPMQRKQEQVNKTITGGAEQKNDSHFIELLAACSALDFLNEPETKLQQLKDNTETNYLFRAIDESGRFESKDFVGKEYADKFAQKFGTLLAFALYCNGDDDIVEAVRSGRDKDIVGFKDMDPNQVKSIKDYFNLFFFKSNDDGSIEEGWTMQLHRSAGGDGNFLFSPSLFRNSKKEMMKVKWNEEIYQSDKNSTYKDHKFSVRSVTNPFGSKFDAFKKVFKNEIDNGEKISISNLAEVFYKRVYNTLGKMYGF